MRNLRLKIDLQLFAEEKTEKATPRRRQEARRKGQVVKSRELNSAVILLYLILVLKYTLPDKIINYLVFMETIFSDYILKSDMYRLSNLAALNRDLFLTVFGFLLPILGTAIVISLIINYIQVGSLFTTEPIKISLERLNPVEGFKRIFSKRAIVELLKSVIKVFLVIYIVYVSIKKRVLSIPLLTDMDIIEAMKYISEMVFDVSIKVSIALLLLSIVDYLYQWREHEHNLMMSKEDIKEEFKQTEGNPLIKSRIKQIQRQVMMRRMMQQIPEADVVITNPYHLAVAIKYESEKQSAPVVIAKGANIIAEKIKEIATVNNIEIVENKPLAHLLYKSVEIGEMIPENLYQAVAEVLAFVYSLKQRREFIH